MALSPEQAWKQGVVAMADAVTFADGRMVLFQACSSHGALYQIHLVGETTFENFLQSNPGWLAEVTAFAEVQTPSRCRLLAGEGPQGADGFIALIDSEGELVYSIFCTASNPFESLTFEPEVGAVRVLTTTGVEWTFNIDYPSVISTRQAVRGR